MVEKKYITAAGVVFGVFAVIFAILMPFHFSYLDYYEYGFKRRKSTGVVDTSEVYSFGRHGLGIDFEFKIFNASAHNVVLKNLDVFTKDKISITLSVAFQYFLRADDLHYLHDAYDIGYATVMRSSAVDALKGITAEFSLHQFFKDRKTVEKGLFKAVRKRLSGQCCERTCDIGGKKCQGCTKPYAECEMTDKGLFVDVRYLQVRNINIADDVQYKYLKSLIQGAKAEREEYIQQSTLVEKDTEEQVKKIENEASVIYENGTAQAALIRSKANAEAKATLEKARSDGLQYLYGTLGITSAKHKASFTYLRSLRDHSDINLMVGFQSANILQQAGGG